MGDKRLICTDCDQLVHVESTYDGYIGVCGCHRYTFRVGSGDRPRTWETVEDVLSPSNFKIEHGDWQEDLMAYETVGILCLRCKRRDATTVSLMRVDCCPIFDMKAVFECSHNHGKYNHGNEAVAYYDHGGKLQSLRDYVANGDCDE